jgi:hypothetical protein
MATDDHQGDAAATDPELGRRYGEVSEQLTGVSYL